MRWEDEYLNEKMVVLKFSAKSIKPIKIEYFKIENCSTANILKNFEAAPTFFLEWNENSYIKNHGENFHGNENDVSEGYVSK